MPSSLRVVLYTANGVGVGHLTRMLALGRALRETARASDIEAAIYCLTTSEATQLLWAEKIPSFKLPSKQAIVQAGGDLKAFAPIARRWVSQTIDALSPDLLVVDSFPEGAFGELPELLRTCQHAVLVCRRQRSDYLRSRQFQTACRYYDKIIIAEHGADHADHVPSDIRKRIVTIGPILLRGRENALSREVARARLHVREDQLAVYATTGGGGHPDCEAILQDCMNAYRDDPSVRLFIGAGPLFTGPVSHADNVTWIQSGAVSELMQGFDLAISAAGYNSYHELMHFGVPTVFVPLPAVEDDQAERATLAESRGAGIRLGRPAGAAELKAAVCQLVSQGLSGASEAARALVPANCAGEAARILLDLTIGTDSRGTRHRTQSVHAPAGASAEYGTPPNQRLGSRNPKIHIVITSSYQCSSLADQFEFWSARLPVEIAAQITPPHQVHQQLLAPESEVRRNSSGINVILLAIPTYRSSGLEGEIATDCGTDSLDSLIRAIDAAASDSHAQFLVCVSPVEPVSLSCMAAPPADPALQAVIRRLEEIPRVRCLDLRVAAEVYQANDAFKANVVGGEVAYRPRFFAVAGAAIVRAVAARIGPRRKAIVLDCDNVLWGGMCGEGSVAIDACRKAFHSFLLDRARSGMLLCVCSKNNEDDALAVFRENLAMGLSEGDLIAHRINWLPKSENLRSLARELNIGIDSLVVLDDEPSECAEIRCRCPESLVAQVPSDSQLLLDYVRHLWALDVADDTADDRLRGSWYRAERTRTSLRSTHATLEEFLDGLEITVSVSRPSSSDVRRVSQLTQRARQFNLSGLGMTEQELAASLLAGTYDCRIARVRDRFGDYGLVAAVVYRMNAGELDISQFVLSCRAMGKNIEDTVLVELLREAEEAGCQSVTLHWRATPHNKQVSRFLARCHLLPGEGAVQTQRVPIRRLLSTENLVQSSYGYRFAAPSDTSEDSDRGRAESLEVAASDKPETPGPTWNEAILKIAEEYRTADAILAMQRRERPSDCHMADFAEPLTPTEVAVRQVWCKVLGTERISVRQSFFDLGFDSLTTLEILELIGKEIGVELPLSVLFTHDFTISELAKLVDNERDRARA